MSDEKVKDVCENCPYNAAFDIGLEAIDRNCENKELHRTDERHKAALGGAILSKELLSKLVSRIGCKGPVNVEGGYIVCPHSKTIYDARQVVEGPNQNSNLMYENLGKQSTETAPGQYL